MSDLMAGLHQPGDTVLHRMPMGAKVLGLALLSLAIVVVRDVRAAPVFLAVTLLLAALARVPLRSVWRAARGVLLIAVVASAFQWWWYGAEKAVETFIDLLSLGLAALALTATTSVNWRPGPSAGCCSTALASSRRQGSRARAPRPATPTRRQKTVVSDSAARWPPVRAV